MRSRAAILLLFIHAAVSLSFLFSRTSLPDGVSDYEKRFIALRTLLHPPLTIGYLPEKAASTASVGRFYLAQYALAPVVLEMGTNRPTVLATFSQETACPERIKEHELVLVSDDGAGVCLYQREER